MPSGKGIKEYADFRLLLILDSRLSRRKSCDRNTERRAGNISQTNLVAELNGRRIAAVLAADTNVHIGSGLLAELDSHFHQLADACLVELCKRIVLEDLSVIVSVQELARVITREAVSHLSQVVCTKAEELSFLSDVIGCESRARNFVSI